MRSESEGWDWNFEGRRGKQQNFRRQTLDGIGIENHVNVSYGL